MGARAIWKGSIYLDEHVFPVKLYSAVQDRAVHFHLLHERDLVRVQQRMVHPSTSEPVPNDRIMRGYEAEPGVFVRVQRDELDALAPEPSRRIEISRFVPPAAVSHPWYDRPYYLGPDGDARPYAELAAGLARAGRVGIAHWVMRKKRYAGVLHARDGRLRIFTLRKREEVVELSQLEAPAGRELDARELALAEQLVAALQGDFDPSALKDEHRARVLELIEAKRSGRTLKKPRPPRKAAPASLARALQASVEKAHKQRRTA